MALTTRFVSAVRRQGSVPSTYLSTDILEIGDGEIQAVFVPLLERVRQNYLVRELTATPDAMGRVPLPTRASGAALRSVQLQVNNTWRPLPQRQLEEYDSLSTGQPDAYFLDGGSVALLPKGSSGTLRIRYPMRPGRMVLDTDTTKAGAISSVTIGPTTTLLATTYTGVDPVDFISSGPAHQAKAIDVPLLALGPVPNTYFTEALVVGDYVAAADCSPFVPLPEELFAALVHRTAGVLLRSLGYDDEARTQLALAGESIDSATPMLLPRNEGNPQRVTGGIRRALGAGRWRGY